MVASTASRELITVALLLATYISQKQRSAAAAAGSVCVPTCVFRPSCPDAMSVEPFADAWLVAECC
jgi:hypothetical protein